MYCIFFVVMREEQVLDSLHKLSVDVRYIGLVNIQCESRGISQTSTIYYTCQNNIKENSFSN